MYKRRGLVFHRLNWSRQSAQSVCSGLCPARAEQLVWKSVAQLCRVNHVRVIYHFDPTQDRMLAGLLGNCHLRFNIFTMMTGVTTAKDRGIKILPLSVCSLGLNDWDHARQRHDSPFEFQSAAYQTLCAFAVRLSRLFRVCDDGR